MKESRDAQGSPPVARADVHFRQLHDGVALYDTSTDTIHILNPVAAYIWTMCDGETTIDHMVDQLTSDTGVSRATAEHDVRDTIRNLMAKKLLKGV
jgi:hypothetical protein